MFLVWWILAQNSGTFCLENQWENIPYLYFYRDLGDIEKEKQAAAEKTVIKHKSPAWAPEFTDIQPGVSNWSEDIQVPYVPIQKFPTEY